METLKVIIIDDERRVRNTLKRSLEECGGVEILAEADTVESARELIRQHPDIHGIFLDIQLPGGTGFDLVQDIQDMQKVVFVTAYDQYAIRAFEVNALDYIMKPAAPERLQQSLRRLRAHLAEATVSDNDEHKGKAEKIGESLSGMATTTKKLTIQDQLLLKFGTKSRFVAVNDLVFVRSADNYTELHVQDGSTALMRKTLEEWFEALPEENFIRLHRSTLVNKRFVEEVTNEGGIKYFVRLRGIQELFPISRSYTSTAREALQ